MNLDLAENTNKLILLVVAGVALLLTLNTYQKQVGKNLAAVLAIVTIVVVGYVAFTLMSRKPVANNANNVNLVNNVNNMPNNANNMPNNANNMPNNVNMAVNNNVPNVNVEEEEVVEGFRGNHNHHTGAHTVNPPNVETFEGGNTNSNEEASEENAEEVANAVANNSNHPADNGVLRCSDLLPADTNSPWAQVSPSGVGELCTKNLLNAGHHIGVNTQGCSLRNANRGLRSEPPNPQVQVSPWLQTTICPDLLRRPLE